MSVASTSPHLRCLVISPSLGRGGAERQAVLVARALFAQGHDVRLFVQSSPLFLRDDGLTADLPMDLPPFAGGIITQLRRLRATVESFEPDAVITFMRGAAGRFAVTRASSLAARRAAWIATARGNTVLGHLAKNPLVFAAHLRWHRLANRIVTPSSSLAGNVLAMDPALADKVVVVPNVLVPFPVDPVRARDRVNALIGGAEHRPVIGSLGSFQDDRNHILLAEALPELVAAWPALHLLVVGQHTGRWYAGAADAFRRRIDQLGLARHVTLAGEVSNGRELLAGLDVFALPSRLEGSSNALAEALFAGVATATTPVADAEGLVAGAGVVSSGWTASSFASAILEALRNAPSLREQATARGKALATGRSTERVGRLWSEVVREAVTEVRASAPRGKV